MTLTAGQLARVREIAIVSARYHRVSQDAVYKALVKALDELVPEMAKDAERYIGLRDLMSKNLPETWKLVEEVAAIGCYTSYSEFDTALDSAIVTATKVVR